MTDIPCQHAEGGIHKYEEQPHQTWCSFACIAMVLNKVMGQKATPLSVGRKYWKEGYSGSFVEIEDILRGERVNCSRWLPKDGGTIGNKIRTPPAGFLAAPVIVHCRTAGSTLDDPGHWILVDGRESRFPTDHFCILDPILLRKHVRMAISKSGTVSYTGEALIKKVRTTVTMSLAATIHVAPNVAAPTT